MALDHNPSILQVRPARFPSHSSGQTNLALLVNSFFLIGTPVEHLNTFKRGLTSSNLKRYCSTNVRLTEIISIEKQRFS